MFEKAIQGYVVGPSGHKDWVVVEREWIPGTPIWLLRPCGGSWGGSLWAYRKRDFQFGNLLKQRPLVYVGVHHEEGEVAPVVEGWEYVDNPWSDMGEIYRQWEETHN